MNTELNVFYIKIRRIYLLIKEIDTPCLVFLKTALRGIVEVFARYYQGVYSPISSIILPIPAYWSSVQRMKRMSTQTHLL